LGANQGVLYVVSYTVQVQNEVIVDSIMMDATLHRLLTFVSPCTIVLQLDSYCHGYFSETYRVLSLKGAEVVVWINGRGGSIQDYYVKTFMEQNLISMICTNQAYGAGTMIAQYPNRIDAVCRKKGEGYVTGMIDLKRLRHARKNSRNFRQRRPELYQEIVNTD
jgi:hypothetical protein